MTEYTDYQKNAIVKAAVALGDKMFLSPQRTALIAALNPSPLPSDDELRTIANTARDKKGFAGSSIADRAIFAAGLRRAHEVALTGEEGCLLVLADEMEGR
jgi:hypothetical protein